MTKMEKICNYVCDKFYTVTYQRYCTESNVVGFLLNYNGGTIDLLTEHGMYHIKYKDVVFMKPLKNFDIEQCNEAFKELIGSLMREDIHHES